MKRIFLLLIFLSSFQAITQVTISGKVTTNKGTKHHAPVVAIASGLGSFEPRKPLLENLSDYEDKGVEYIIKEPEMYRNKN